MSFLSLRLLPLAENDKVHHLLYVGGVVAFRSDVEWASWKELTLCGDKILAIPEQAFDKDLFLNQVDTNKIVVLFELSDIEKKISRLQALTQEKFNILILVAKEPTQKQLDVFGDIHRFSNHVQLLILENKNHPMNDILDTLPLWLKARTLFVYLPKKNFADCLLNPQEVVERIKYRTSQCGSHEVAFQLGSFGAGSTSDPILSDFYEAPSLDRFLRITERQNYCRYVFLLVIRSTGLAGVLGFLFWMLKIMFNPSGYNIWQELCGWGSRGLGWFKGRTIDIRGIVVALSVKAYWLIRSFLGGTWKLRVFVHSLMGQSWRVRVFLGDLLSRRWKIKVYIQRLLGQTWKLRVLLHRFIIWARWRIFYQFFNVLLFPFKKAYWFLKYQYEKRILKNNEIDHEL